MIKFIYIIFFLAFSNSNSWALPQCDTTQNNFKHNCIGSYNNGYEQYNGEWKNNKFHGFGKWTFANGSRYEGQFYEGKKHGKGKLFHGLKLAKEGIWKNGEFQFPTTNNDYVKKSTPKTNFLEKCDNYKSIKSSQNKTVCNCSETNGYFSAYWELEKYNRNLNCNDNTSSMVNNDSGYNSQRKSNYSKISNYDDLGIWFNDSSFTGELQLQNAIVTSRSRSWQLLSFINNTLYQEDIKRSMFNIRDSIIDKDNTRYFLVYEVLTTNANRLFKDVLLKKNSVGTHFRKLIPEQYPSKDEIYFNVLSTNKARFFKTDGSGGINCILYIESIDLKKTYCFSQFIENGLIYIFKYKIPSSYIKSDYFTGDLLNVKGRTEYIGTIRESFPYDLDEGILLSTDISVKKIASNVAKYHMWLGNGSGPFGVRKGRSYKKIRNILKNNPSKWKQSIFIKP